MSNFARTVQRNLWRGNAAPFQLWAVARGFRRPRPATMAPFEAKRARAARRAEIHALVSKGGRA